MNYLSAIKKIEIILTKPILLEQAERNFKELQKYDTRILDKKRHDFYAIVAGKTSNVG